MSLAMFQRHFQMIQRFFTRQQVLDRVKVAYHDIKLADSLNRFDKYNYFNFSYIESNKIQKDLTKSTNEQPSKL